MTDDAITTAKFAIRDAIAETAHITGLKAGDESEALVEAIFTRFADPGVGWAFKQILSH